MRLTRETPKGNIYICSIVKNLEKLLSRVTLNAEEIEIYNRIGSPHRKSEWLTSRAIIQKMLGAEVTTTYSKIGAPCLIGSNKRVSISHSGDLVAVYISDEECGIDIERCDRDFSRVQNRFLSPEELSLLTPEGIAIAWGVKEAAYKLFGRADIEFATMFTIKEMNIAESYATLYYQQREYRFNLIQVDNYNIAYI